MSLSPLSHPAAWNDVAEGYVDELVPIFSLYARDALRLAGLPSGAHVLDVATGPGTLALLAAETAGHVVAVDFAEAMTGALRQRAAEHGITNVEALQADGQQLPFEAARFDRAFSMFGLIFFPDRGAGFRELVRVLKPGGRAVVSSWAPFDRVPLLNAFFTALGDLLPDFPFGDGAAPLGEPGSFRAEMEDAGFRQVEIHTVTHTVHVPSLAAYWRANARSSAPLSLVRSRLSPEAWEQLGRNVVAELTRTFGDGPLDMHWPALLGVGVR